MNIKSWVWLAIFPAVVGSVLSVSFTVGRLVAGTETLVVQVYTIMKKLETLEQGLKIRLDAQDAAVTDLYDKIGRLESGISYSEIGEEKMESLTNRLSTLEQAFEPFKDRPKLSSQEFSLLLFELDKLKADLETQEDGLNRSLDTLRSNLTYRLNVSDSNHTKWMAIISVLFTLSIAILSAFYSRLIGR